MNKNINICNNCGKQGHIFNQCRQPIISYGIILFCKSNATNKPKYLMIRRRNTFGYIDFIRGRYSLNNISHLQGLFAEMSSEEKNNILQCDFGQLWTQMWGLMRMGIQHRHEESCSKKKFDCIKCDGIVGDCGKIYGINDLILTKSDDIAWTEPEWEFPKGRRNFYQEKDIECAVREFEEETGLGKNNINIVSNIMPFEEIFIGSNNKSYKHKFFLAFSDHELDELHNFQCSEVSCVEWKSFDECIQCMRPYCLEKKRILSNINKIVEEYRLY